ncbi:hypothetical protein RFI_31852 [Reticulomyxa filosa]|uniref:TRAF-type domain-containing protein n=1 Tax=Reticulomyxa filosa TaxID=46433 RepID=X6LUE4_RETFI|nr:hypothetical protein RFI_31852 [Reticulomyxa filosa]|eukprot:ETO05543.1 hypothetical protein RFI_31852 [Reticulomyxa filosa]
MQKQKDNLSLSECYNKDWVSLTNEPQGLSTLICCLCKQIANNAVELRCDEHENVEHVYLVGEECLQKYLKQSQGKCPIEQHNHCEFSQNKMARKLVSELLISCPRQFNLKERQVNEGIKSAEENVNELNSNSKSTCNYKGKIKGLNDHLDKCNLISNKEIIQSEIGEQFNVVNEQIVKWQKMVEDLQLQIERTNEKKNKQIEQINVNLFFLKYFC